MVHITFVCDQCSRLHPDAPSAQRCERRDASEMAAQKAHLEQLLRKLDGGSA
jgi:hypothetical protein